MRLIVRPGLRFWEYLGLANPKISKPKIWIPDMLVNCSNNQQFILWTDPMTGRVQCNLDANYVDFEKGLIAKMESTIRVPPDNKNVRNEVDRIQYEKDQKKKMLEDMKKKKFFYSMRKRLSENDAMVV